MKIYAHSLKKEDWFSIAKCIDNDFTQSRATFTADRFFTYYMLTTNVCDSCSIVKVYFTSDGFITKIVRVSDDTDGYVEVRESTYKRIFNLFK